MSKLGRNFFAILTEGHTPSNTNGVIDLSPGFSAKKSELKNAIFIAPESGTPGQLVVTLSGTYAVGDFIRVTTTSNLTSRSQWRKSYTYTVQAGSTSLADIASAIAALIKADISDEAPYSVVSSAAGVITIIQKGDDKRGIVGYTYTDSAAGIIAHAVTSTVISEGQPSDLVDRGVGSADNAYNGSAVDVINLPEYDTVRIQLAAEAAIPFIDSTGITNKEIYWYGTPGEGASLIALINS